MEKRENAHFMLPASIRSVLAVLAAESGREKSEIVERALRKYAPIKAKLNGKKES